MTAISAIDRVAEAAHASRRIVEVEVASFDQSLWGPFWDIQKSAPSVSPMSRYPEYASALESWWWPQALVLIRVITEDGNSGIGWAEGGTGAAAAVIEGHLKHLLIGQDATRIEALLDQMYRASIPYMDAAAS